MFVRDILARKGNAVVSVTPETTVSRIVGIMREQGVGSVLVRLEDGTLAGVLSERDVVTALAEHGVEASGRVASQLIGATMATCGPDDSITLVMSLMTDLRVRHLPVLDQGRLSGLVSIGDVVKARLAEMKDEAEMLREYIATA